MAKVFASSSMSLDGYSAGPKPSMKDPLGIGGEQLHEWAFALEGWREPHKMAGGKTGSESDLVVQAINRTGAVIMGRKMFSGGTGPWEKDKNSTGWWGDNPPFHVPVFVLTSHSRDTLVMKGNNTFTFVTEGIQSAYKQAKKTAGNKDIQIAGGASAIQQFIKAGLLDELLIQLIPIILGGGTRLMDNIDPMKLQKISVADFPLATHLKYRIKN